MRSDRRSIKVNEVGSPTVVLSTVQYSPVNEPLPLIAAVISSDAV